MEAWRSLASHIANNVPPRSICESVLQVEQWRLDEPPGQRGHDNAYEERKKLYLVDLLHQAETLSKINGEQEDWEMIKVEAITNLPELTGET
jgi:hypothetical protein